MKRGLVVIGLTGSIGMGKSTAASMLREMHIPVFDADAEVHRMFRPGGAAVAAVGEAFPGVVQDGAVDRKELGKRVFGDKPALRRLERIVHPLVGQAERRFLIRAALRGARMVVRDVPLLFETGGDKRCDVTIVVSAPAHIQAQRVLRREGMTAERLATIRGSQMQDAEKRRRADYVVPTGQGLRLTRDRLRDIVDDIKHGAMRRDAGRPRKPAVARR